MIKQNNRMLSRSYRDRSGSSSNSSEEGYDSPYEVGKLKIIPSSTRHWNMVCLDSVGVIYSDNYFQSPLDVLDFIFEKTVNFGPLKEKDKEHVKNVQDSMSFSMFVEELLQLTTDKRESVLIPVSKQIEKDLDNLHQLEFRYIISPYNFDILLGYFYVRFTEKETIENSLSRFHNFFLRLVWYAHEHEVILVKRKPFMSQKCPFRSC